MPFSRPQSAAPRSHSAAIHSPHLKKRTSYTPQTDLTRSSSGRKRRQNPGFSAPKTRNRRPQSAIGIRKRKQKVSPYENSMAGSNGSSRLNSGRSSGEYSISSARQQAMMDSGRMNSSRAKHQFHDPTADTAYFQETYPPSDRQDENYYSEGEDTQSMDQQYPFSTHDILDEVTPEEKLDLVNEELESLEDVLENTTFSSIIDRFRFEEKLIQLRVEAMALCILMYGTESLKTMESIINLGTAYIDIGNYPQATIHLKRALGMITAYMDDREEEEEQEHMRDSHRSQIRRLHSIVSNADSNENETYSVEDDFRRGSTLSVAPEEGQNSEEAVHDLLPNLLCALSKAYIHMAEDETALSCLQEARRQHRRLNPDKDTHYEIELLFYMLHDKNEEYSKAIESLQQAWQAKDEETQGDQNHPDIASIYQRMGTVYRKQGSYNEAFDSWKTALKIYASLKDDKRSMGLYCGMGALQSSQGNGMQALEYFESAYHLSVKVHGLQSEETIGILETLAQLHYSVILEKRQELAQVEESGSQLSIQEGENADPDAKSKDEVEETSKKEAELEELLTSTVRLLEMLIQEKLETLQGFEPKKMVMLYERLGDCYGLLSQGDSQKIAYRRARRLVEEHFPSKALKATRKRLSEKYSRVVSELRNSL